ncbi:hypothetical protein PWT90_10978 [Aphanocladium album]|nr:hypothetical protein PWT90_10978 [Aphanocladium album]
MGVRSTWPSWDAGAPYNAKQHRHITAYDVALTNIRDRPTFTIAQWDHVPRPTDGLRDNTVCWPTAKAPGDPGFALLNIDPAQAMFNRGNADYSQPYVPGVNGV